METEERSALMKTTQSPRALGLLLIRMGKKFPMRKSGFCSIQSHIRLRQLFEPKLSNTNY